MTDKREQQKIFNKVWKHFVVDKGRQSALPSDGRTPRCFFRGPDGAKCMVGLFIPDKEYKPELEQHGSVPKLLECGLLTADTRSFLRRNKEVLKELQGIHDHIDTKHHDRFTASVERDLRIFAQEHELQIPKEKAT